MSTSIYPPEYTSDVGQARVLATDTQLLADPADPLAVPDYYFSDAQIGAFLSINRGKVRAAAADMVDALASNEALVSKKIRTEDLQTDGPAVSNALRLHATALRAAQKRDDDEDASNDAFAVVDFVPLPANWPLR